MAASLSSEHVAITLESLASMLKHAFEGPQHNDLKQKTAFDESPSAFSQALSHCEALMHPNILATCLAAFLVAGIVLSYVPQHLKIIRRQSSEGLSAWWVLLGGLSSITAIGNIMVLPTSREDMACCKVLNGPDCAAALLGVVQIGCQWLCFTIMSVFSCGNATISCPLILIRVLLYVIYYPETVSASEDISASAATLIDSTPKNSKQDQLLVGISYFLSLFLIAIVSVATVSVFPHHTQTWADILGVISGALAAVQYVPQIWHTWKAKDVKSLSIITLISQAPGAFLFALSLGLRVGTKGWSTWIVYIITGTLQFVLLAMAILFLYRIPRDNHGLNDPSTRSAESCGQIGETGLVVDQANERTPLLVDSNP